MKPLGHREQLGKSYLCVLMDGNSDAHTAAIGHGGTESTPEWLFFFDLILKFLYDNFKTELSIFSDEAAAISAAIENVLPRFTDHYLCAMHKKGNVKKHFGVEASKVFMALANAYTSAQYMESVRKIQDMSPNTQAKLYNGKRLQETLEEYILDQEAAYVKFKIKKSRYDFVSTAPVESLNHVPGTSRSPFGRGNLRYLSPVFCSAGYLIWYYERMRMKQIVALEDIKNGFVLTSHARGVLKCRLEKLIGGEVKKPDDITLNAFCIGARARTSTETTDQILVNGIEENKHSRREYTVDFRGKKCGCGMYQEKKIPCKHSLYIIYYRVFQTFNVPDGFDKAEKYRAERKKLFEYILEKNLIDHRYSMASYVEMFEAMELDKHETPDLDTFSKFERDTEAIPRAPLDNQHPDHNSKWYHTKIGKKKRPGRQKEARFIAAGKSKNDL